MYTISKLFQIFLNILEADLSWNDQYIENHNRVFIPFTRLIFNKTPSVLNWQFRRMETK